MSWCTRVFVAGCVVVAVALFGLGYAADAPWLWSVGAGALVAGIVPTLETGRPPGRPPEDET